MLKKFFSITEHIIYRKIRNVEATGKIDPSARNQWSDKVLRLFNAIVCQPGPLIRLKAILHQLLVLYLTKHQLF